MFHCCNCWDNTVRDASSRSLLTVCVDVRECVCVCVEMRLRDCLHCSFEKFVTVTASLWFLTSPVMLKISAASVAVTPYQHSFLKLMLTNIQKPHYHTYPVPGGQEWKEAIISLFLYLRAILQQSVQSLEFSAQLMWVRRILMFWLSSFLCSRTIQRVFSTANTEVVLLMLLKIIPFYLRLNGNVTKERK